MVGGGKNSVVAAATFAACRHVIEYTRQRNVPCSDAVSLSVFSFSPLCAPYSHIFLVYKAMKVSCDDRCPDIDATATPYRLTPSLRRADANVQSARKKSHTRRCHSSGAVRSASLRSFRLDSFALISAGEILFNRPISLFKNSILVRNIWNGRHRERLHISFVYYIHSMYRVVDALCFTHARALHRRHQQPPQISARVRAKDDVLMAAVFFLSPRWWLSSLEHVEYKKWRVLFWHL